MEELVHLTVEGFLILWAAILLTLGLGLWMAWKLADLKNRVDVLEYKVRVNTQMYLRAAILRNGSWKEEK